MPGGTAAECKISALPEEGADISARTCKVDEDGSCRKTRRMLPRPERAVREKGKSRINTVTEISSSLPLLSKLKATEA